MSKKTFSRCDTADYLRTEEEMTASPNECVADGKHPALPLSSRYRMPMAFG